MIQMFIYLVVFWSCTSLAAGLGLMLLYRPQDISKDCAVSRYLRYDLSYGMGMSDTITLVFRTLFDIDYECVVDIVAETDQVTLLIVVRYPTLMGLNCEVNRDAITVLNNNNKCYRLCDFVEEQYSVLTIFPVTGNLRFRFVSNSSINSDINAYMYQVTATAARPINCKTCCRRNETYCYVANHHYCFTSGVVCDGINNCGLDDWFDERKSLCNLPAEKLGYAPVIAVAAVLLCTILAASHVLIRCLPPQANSFFIFNANEDNRLCIDPLLKPRNNASPQPEKPRAMSLVPVFSSSSSGSEFESKGNIDNLSEALKTFKPVGESSKDFGAPPSRRKITMRSMTAKIQEKFRSITGSRSFFAATPLETFETKTMDV